MIDDIKLAIECKHPVKLVNRMGGNLIDRDSIMKEIRNISGTVATQEGKINEEGD